MKFQTLNIENFRGISNLEITDFGKINLLVGRNNCGKTSVLEAGILVSGMANPQLSVSIHNFRGLILTNDEDFSFMFKNLDFNIPIQLNGRIDSNERKLTITPFYGFYQTKNDDKTITAVPQTFSASSNNRMVEGINLDFVTHQGQKYHGECHLKLPITIPKYIENFKCLYVGSETSKVLSDKQIGDVIVHKRLGSIISVLKEIEPAVQDIQMGPGSVVYVDIGAKHLIPINVMGGGMRKTIALLTAISAMQGGALLIDEIENGLYYSSLSVVWKAVFAACKVFDVQLIATTHSLECVEAFSKTYDTFDPKGDDIRVIRIYKDDKQHKTVVYHADVLKAGIEKEFEIR